MNGFYSGEKAEKNSGFKVGETLLIRMPDCAGRFSIIRFCLDDIEYRDEDKCMLVSGRKLKKDGTPSNSSNAKVEQVVYGEGSPYYGFNGVYMGRNI